MFKQNSISKEGYELLLIKYVSSKEVYIKIVNGNGKDYIKRTKYKDFIEGSVRNSFHPSVYNIGFVGIGKYKTSIKSKPTKCYDTWVRMLERAYSDKYKTRYPTYKNVTVCEEWHNFQNFAEWFEENYYEVDGERMELDKDILSNTPKIYSKNTCIFLPQRINVLFVKNDSKRGDCKLGVILCKRSNKYIARCSIGNKNKYLGLYETEYEAHKSYINFKNEFIKEIVEEYKNKIPSKIYDILKNYKIKMEECV